MFKKNTAVTGFAVGFINATTGAAVTAGTPTGTVTLDGGVQAAIAGAFTHEGNGLWTVNLTGGEMNGTIVGLTFSLTNAINVYFTIKTVLIDPDNATTAGLTNLDAAVSTRMATYTQPAGFLAATFPAGTVANTTNITAAAGIVLSGVTHTNAIIPTVSAVTGLTAATVHADLDDIQARLPAALVAGRIDASVGAVAANAITAASIADGAIDMATFAADTGLAPIRSNTAQAGAATTITLDAAASAVDSFYNNSMILLTGGTGVGQARFITAYVGATKVATVAAWATAPALSTTFSILPADAIASVGSVTGNVAGSVASVTGSVGSVVGLTVANLDVAVSTRMATFTQPAGFLAATFPAGTVANTTNITAGTITTTTNLTNAPTAGDLTAAMIVSVKTQAVAALNTDTYAEPVQGAPLATTTLSAKIGYLYKNARNKKTQTSTTFSLFSDDGITVDHKSTVSDDATTATRAEVVSGP